MWSVPAMSASPPPFAPSGAVARTSPFGAGDSALATCGGVDELGDVVEDGPAGGDSDGSTGVETAGGEA